MPKWETGELEVDLAQGKVKELLEIYRYGDMEIGVLQIYGHEPVAWLN